VRIGIVSKDEEIASLFDEELEGSGHTVVRGPNISTCATADTGLIFAEWSPGPDFAQVLRELVQYANSAAPIPVVVMLRGESMSLWQRAQDSGAFDVIICPPSVVEIRAEIASVAGSLTPFNPAEHERFENLRRRKIIGESPVFKKCVEAARLAARSNVNVLILGPSGTGKDVIAWLIHELSSRSGQPFVALNCGAIAGELAETELFGSARGAFTGAVDRAGVFEQAAGGTLFLDEIGAMRTDHQVKVL